MIGTEQEALTFAITDCATNGREWLIEALTDGIQRTIWIIERDTKVDEDDLSWPVIVHLHGAMGSDQVAILVEQVISE